LLSCLTGEQFAVTSGYWLPAVMRMFSQVPLGEIISNAFLILEKCVFADISSYLNQVYAA
jgi:hypothetical protein